MKEKYVSFEQAQVLRRLGFDGECDYCYLVENGELSFEEVDIYAYEKATYCGCDMLNAPTLSLAQAWLREIKHIYVYPEINCLKKWFAKAVDMERNEDLIWDGTMFNSYEDALSYGIDECLKLVETNDPEKE